jgi:Na+/H+-dicarboxylate symporter
MVKTINDMGNRQPVTMQTAEDRLGVSNQVSRFVLPICTTINMNGCAAFILVHS